jgi:poly-gamma-glutamate capsule biosynthesis protein CapA/YwtB (metallophosphatase superfamily)
VNVRLVRSLLAPLAIAVGLAACSAQQAGLDAPSRTDPPVTAAPTTTAPTTTTAAPTTTTRPLRQIRMAFTGDTMAHSAVSASGARHGRAGGVPYDFAPMWDGVRAQLSAADLAICHLETTLSTGDSGITGYPRFRAPRSFATALAGAGFDGCSTASNHSFDYGVAGVIDTAAVLEEEGLRFAGTARSADEAAAATVYEVDGVRIAHLSVTYGLNGLVLPRDQPWLVDPIDIPAILERAAAARAGGAHLVVVSVHCCTEYRTQPTAVQLEHARVLLESPDIDLYVGHHAHVVQPVERLGDKYVLYGLGNILSNMYQGACCPASTQDGVIVEVSFAETAAGRFVATGVRYTPTWVDRAAGHLIVPVAAALRDPGTPAAQRAVLEQSWQRTVAAIMSRAGADDGIAPTDEP